MFEFGDDWDEEEENVQPERPLRFQPTYILLALDVGSKMFIKNEQGFYPFVACLEGLSNEINNLLLMDEKGLRSPLGVVLATNNDDDFPFIKFEDNMVNNYAKLKELLTQSVDELKGRYERIEPLKFDEFFMKCQTLLVDVNADVYKRQVVMVTDDDDPEIEEDMKFRALNILRNYPLNKLYIDVITYNPNFDYNILYSEFITEAHGSVKEEYLEDSKSFSEKVKDLIVFRFTKFQQKFYIIPSDEKQYFSMVEWHYVKEKNLRNNLYVNSVDGKEVVKGTSADVDPEEVNFVAKFDKETITLTGNEKTEIKSNPLLPGYHLHNVAKRSLETGHYMDSPLFLQLDLKAKNRDVYRTMWDYCYNQEKVLVCTKKHNIASDIVFAELIPMVVDSKAMFMVLRAPTSDCLQYTHKFLDPPVLCTERSLEEMTKLVNEMIIPYNPDDYYKVFYRRKIEFVRSQLTGEPAKEIPPLDTQFKDLAQAQAVEVHMAPIRVRRNPDELNEQIRLLSVNGITGFVPTPQVPPKAPPRKRVRN